MEDPWPPLEADVQRQLAEVGSTITRWRLLCDSSERSEAALLRASLLKMLTEMDVDLEDMSATVEIATKDPHKFGLDAAELQHRVDFVRISQQQAAELRAELIESDGRLTAKADKERAERLGLLAKDKPCGKPTGAVGSSAAWEAKQCAVCQQNESTLQQQQQSQQAAIAEQDEQLGVLSGVANRLGRMARNINEELRAQGRALDEFTQEVDETHGRMAAALNVMQKMLKSKDRGKFCAIIVLTILLAVLLVLVFS
mmetsp:Transcript_8560/g.14445  ORF Transcript_8560/g.14445 Transcript_8560/m.14445 type:complete len:256 (-) Transcript_8560:355-1122(-)|eukprot:CAMPEP_0119317910 /NCGR_PEP_ID=MMETSP1333-20130426/44818_1 /TAXON_ID=418940 /ORGANISM="Scyphosphaera apsteinii, Strain RCC1455" /LENGTH=255 /DNA_ID=CAMNT_0007323981 /DNA_START=78 /DNA_END=845 /DNA_ORIENTATION=-